MKHQPKKLRDVPTRTDSHLRMKQVSDKPLPLPVKMENDVESIALVDLSEAWMSFEMEAQWAALAFVIDGIGTDQHLLTLAQRALSSRPIEPHPSVDECVTRTALSVLAGLDPEEVPFRLGNQSSNPATYFFEKVALGWIRWISAGDISIFTEIASLRAETGNATRDPTQQIDLIVLHLWSKGLDFLVREHLKNASAFFQQAASVGEQVGSDYCAPIKWIFVSSMILKRRSRPKR
jgi:hypothetical protein